MSESQPEFYKLVAALAHWVAVKENKPRPEHEERASEKALYEAACTYLRRS